MAAISAMQLNGQLTYLKPSDLRFSAGEAQTLLAMAGVKLDKSQIEALVQKTQGWAVALQLARVLLRDGAVTDRDLLELSGTQLDMARYLSEQVFSSLSVPMQSALVGVAALPYFSAELASAVVSPSAAAELASDIAVGGLPIEAFDDGHRQFKLHAVFQEYLIQEVLARGLDINQIRRSAAYW